MRNKENKKFIEKAIKEISKRKYILDIGGGQRFGKWLKEYENILSNCDYKTFDYDTNTGADIIGDIHKIPIDEESVDAIICSSVLEHVKNPLMAVEELYRVLKNDGLIFLYVPSTYPYHARKGHYPDYWRFFDDTLIEMFKKFKHFEIEKQGGYFKAMSFFFPMQHKLRFILEPLSYYLDRVFKTRNRNTTAGYYVFAKK